MEAVICYNFTIKNKIQVSDAQVVWASGSELRNANNGRANYSVNFVVHIHVKIVVHLQ